MPTAAVAKSTWRPSINERNERPMEMGYVLKDVFNARMDRMEALMERNLLKYEAFSNEIRGHMEQFDRRLDQMDRRMDQMDKRLDKMEGRMDKMDDRMNRMEGEIGDIKGDVKALTLAFSTMQNRFALHLAWMGIVVGLALALAQHFWR